MNTDVFYNHSMLEDERMNEIERTQRRFGVRYVDNPLVGAPVGHLYSFMVEELKIEKPNLENFINELNSYIEMGGDGFAKIEDPTTNLYSRTNNYLILMLQDKIFEGKLGVESAERIMYEAMGNCNYRKLKYFVERKD